MDQPSVFSAIFGATTVYLYWGVWILTNLGCAYFVYQSAIRRKSSALNISAYWWALFTVFGGIWTLLVYWLMEHSSLARRDDTNELREK